MGTFGAWQVVFGMMVLGAALLWLAWLLLVEYRKAFIADPVSVMSFEVLAAILRHGGPGYIAAFAIVIGAIFLVTGLLAFLLMLTVSAVTALSPLWEALVSTFRT